MSATAPDEVLIGAARAGDRRALARLLTLVESGGRRAEAVVERLRPSAASAHVIGITGSPGTGKSTLVNALARAVRLEGRTVAVVAIDPSSPFTGGALLGDRVRMGALAGDGGVFVRSMASRGASGGLATNAAAAATTLAGAGFDVVLLETVGAGQGELAVAGETQTTVVVTAPGGGDEIQALKSGILEIADVLVVNKADEAGADRLVAALAFGRGGVPAGASGAPGPSGAAAGASASAAGARGDGLAPSPRADWTAPILKTVATTGEGVPDLLDALHRHRAWIDAGADGGARMRALSARRILRHAAALALATATERAQRSGAWRGLVEAVATGAMTVPVAADALFSDLGRGAGESTP